MKSSMSHREIMRLFKWCRTVTIEKARRKEANKLKNELAMLQKKREKEQEQVEINSPQV